MQTDVKSVVGPTMLGVVGQQCWELLAKQCWESLANNVTSFAKGLIPADKIV